MGHVKVPIRGRLNLDNEMRLIHKNLHILFIGYVRAKCGFGINILKHISIVVLQDVESEIKTDAEEFENIYFKHEEDVTPVVSVKEVKDSEFFCVFMCLLYSMIHLGRHKIKLL